MAKKLVAYFSASGTTAQVAQDLSAAIDADLFEIVPVDPYSPGDLNWRDSASRTSIEMNDEACRPKIAAKIPDIKLYDAVFVGFPLWWQRAPRIISTFLESYDFSGMTLIPFATSGSSDIYQAQGDVQALAADARVLPGRLCNGSPSGSELRTWAERTLENPQ